MSYSTCFPQGQTESNGDFYKREEKGVEGKKGGREKERDTRGGEERKILPGRLRKEGVIFKLALDRCVSIHLKDKVIKTSQAMGTLGQDIYIFCFLTESSLSESTL